MRSWPTGAVAPMGLTGLGSTISRFVQLFQFSPEELERQARIQTAHEDVTINV
jgi:hypothetical protein